MNRKIAIVAVAACGALTVSLWAANITLDQVPAKAKAALQKLAGSNKIAAVETEKEHGVQIYEGEWVADGVKTAAEVTADGILLEMEEGVAPENVPDAVKAEAAKAFGAANKVNYEKHTVVFYEVEGKVDGKAKEISISPAGQQLGQEEDEADDDDAAEGDN